MMFTTYAPRVAANPTRTGVQRDTSAIRLLVVHTSEGSENTTSAEALASFIATPRTSTNLASYHYVADTDDVIPIVPDNFVAFANAGANSDGLSICYPGTAAQNADQWHDANSDAMHEQVARWLADKTVQYRIPLIQLGTEQVKAGARGVCGHNEVSQAFHQSTHTDPGPSYPWAFVLNRARQLLAAPNPEDKMPEAVELWKLPDHDAVYIVNLACGFKTWIPPSRTAGNPGRVVDQRVELHKLNGWDPEVKTQNDRDMFAAYGPVIGPRPAEVDDYGIPNA